MDKNQHNFVHTMLNVVTWISRSAAWLLIPILLLDWLLNYCFVAIIDIFVYTGVTNSSGPELGE